MRPRGGGGCAETQGHPLGPKWSSSPCARTTQEFPPGTPANIALKYAAVIDAAVKHTDAKY